MFWRKKGIPLDEEQWGTIIVFGFIALIVILKVLILLGVVALLGWLVWFLIF